MLGDGNAPIGCVLNRSISQCFWKLLLPLRVLRMVAIQSEAVKRWLSKVKKPMVRRSDEGKDLSTSHETACLFVPQSVGPSVCQFLGLSV